MISLLYETVSQVLCHFEGFVFCEAVFGNELCEKRAVHTTGNIVTCRNGQKCPRVIVKSDVL